jgi:hypothetical protein
MLSSGERGGLGDEGKQPQRYCHRAGWGGEAELNSLSLLGLLIDEKAHCQFRLVTPNRPFAVMQCSF